MGSTGADAIATFWTWWPTARPRIEAAIHGGKSFAKELVNEINDHVRALHADIDWELSPGTRSKHALALSPKADPELRLLTEIWRSRGPAADGTWEFYGARQGGPQSAGLRLEIDGVEVMLDELSVAFEVDPARERVDGVYFHPKFRGMTEDLRRNITFLIIDGAFGEDGVERWLGSITTAETKPAGARPMAELRAAVEALAKSATAEQYAVLTGEDDTGAPVFITANRALKRIDHLLYVMHVEIDVGILAPDENGLTTKEEAGQLDVIEDVLYKSLRGAAVYYARETRRGRRVLHYFAPEDGSAKATIEAWSRTHRERGITSTWRRDPTWEIQRRFS